MLLSQHRTGGSALWKRQGLVLAAIVLLSASRSAASKKRMQGEVETLTLEKSSTCDLMAKSGDKLAVHYVGKYKNGTIFDEGTYRVGRPQEFTLGETGTFNSVIEGWHVGVEGMCLNEKRRLVIPPHLAYGNGEVKGADTPKGTLVFDIELISINGSREAPKAMESSQYCDSCLLLVERFHEQWTETMTKQMKSKQPEQAAGDRPPSLTYDDKTEEMVQGFCDSKPVMGGDQAPFLKEACIDLMKGYKREITGAFLSSVVEPRGLPEKKITICQEMTKACPAVAANPPSSRCSRCKTVIDNLAFDLRMQGPIRKKEGIKRQLWDTLEHLCVKMQYRVPKATKTQEMCEDIIDEHGHELERAVLRGDDWPVITDLMCRKLNQHCKAEELKDEL